MMYICKKIECQAIWQIMSQRMNTNMKTNTKTDQILRPSDSLHTIEKKHGRESKTCPYDFFVKDAEKKRNGEEHSRGIKR